MHGIYFFLWQAASRREMQRAEKREDKCFEKSAFYR